MSLKALIFDVDGTLADTEEGHRSAFNRAFESHHLDWCWSARTYRDLLQVTGGQERLRAFARSLALAPVEDSHYERLIADIHATKNRFYQEWVATGSVQLREGVERLMGEALASGCKIGIATTTTRSNVEALLRATLGHEALARFAVIAAGDDVAHKKPAADIYHLALQRLHVAASEAVAFEDSQNGLLAARGAHLWTVVTPTYWTHGGNFLDAQLVLERLGAPESPLPREPGQQLQKTAWLTFEELEFRTARITV